MHGKNNIILGKNVGKIGKKLLFLGKIQVPLRKDCRKTNTGGEKNPTEGPFYNIKRRVRAPVYRVCLEFYSRARVFLEFYSRAGPFLSIL